MAAIHEPETLPATLADVLRELAAIRARVAALEARDGQSADTNALFLISVAAVVQDRAFTSAELINHAVVDDALRAALRGLDAKRLGKKLRALAGRPHGGLMVTCVAREALGRLWAIVPMADALA